jgi:putative ABC transport system permease protein
MWRNYLKIAFRNFGKNRFFSLVNILGLSIGLAAAILLILYICNEFSFDRFHVNRDRIWRTCLVMDRGNQTETAAVGTAGIGPSMLEELPEVKAMVRFSYPRGGHYLTSRNVNFSLERLTYCDSSVFDVFSFRMTAGNPARALTEPYSVVLTRTTAEKVFGNQNPLNQLVTLNDRDLLKVTGVVQDPPVTSQLQFDALVSFVSLYHDTNMYLDWDGGHDYLTYVMLHEDADTGTLTARFPGFMEEHINYKYKQFGITMHLQIEPLTRVHLFSKSDYDLDTRGDRGRILITSAIALFILVIACINFMNLSTAQSVRRIKEVGLRKVMGATQRELVWQFLSEAALISLVAFLVALILIEIVQPFFNDMVGAQLGLYQRTNLALIPWIILLVLLTGLFAGSYPAFFMARFAPERIFQGDLLSGRGKPVVRNLLVVVQFFISVILIICTLVILGQMNFIKKRDLGFNKNGVVLIFLGSETSIEKAVLLKNEFRQLPEVVAAGASSDYPGQGFTRNGYLPEGFKDPIMFYALDIDPDFLGVLGIPVVEGNGFSDVSEADAEAFLINQTLARELNWTEPVGKVISRYGRHPVIGVVGDFHFASLHEPVGPLVITRQPWGGFSVLAVRLNTTDTEPVLQKMEKIWQQIVPNETFSYEFLDRFIQGAYEPEKRFGRLFLWFSLLAVFIAGLGLLGLAAYSTAQRRHEIAIRKVLGAGEKVILRKLVTDFLKWILVACVLAWPVAWVLMSRWLDGFAYRTGMAVWPYFIATAIALAVGTVTVVYFSLRAARRNPIDGIRSG